MTASRVWTVIWRWGPPIAVMAVIFVLSAQPGLRVSSDNAVDGPARHGAHVAIYALLAALLLRSLTWDRPFTIAAAAWAVGLAIAYGVTDELHQTFVPDRTGQPIDVVWDGLGAMLGVVVARITWPIWRR